MVGQSPKKGFWVSKAVCSGWGLLRQPAPHSTLSPAEACLEPIDRAACWLLCHSPQIANPAKITASEYIRESFSPSGFIRPVLGFKLCDEHEGSAFEELGREFVTSPVLSSPGSSAPPPPLGLAHPGGC